MMMTRRHSDFPASFSPPSSVTSVGSSTAASAPTSAQARTHRSASIPAAGVELQPRRLLAKLVRMLLRVGAGTMLAMSSLAYGAWPEIRWPASLRATPEPQDLRYNGVPMRVWEFASRDPLPKVIEHFSSVLGATHYRQQRGASVVMGRQDADWLIHVQLVPDVENMRDGDDLRLAGTSGRVAVTDLSAGRKHDPQSALTDPFDSTHFLGSRVLSDIHDLGSDRASRHIVYSNGHTLKTNRETLVRLMARRGFALEAARARNGAEGAITLLFRGQGREATAVIRQYRGETGVVLHTLVRNDELAGYRP